MGVGQEKVYSVDNGVCMSMHGNNKTKKIFMGIR